MKRQIDWNTIFTVVYIVVVLALVANRKVPLTMRFWHATMAASRKGAYTFGRVGIYAEKAYWEAVERARA